MSTLAEDVRALVELNRELLERINAEGQEAAAATTVAADAPVVREGLASSGRTIYPHVSVRASNGCSRWQLNFNDGGHRRYGKADALALCRALDDLSTASQRLSDQREYIGIEGGDDPEYMGRVSLAFIACAFGVDAAARWIEHYQLRVNRLGVKA